MTKKETIGIFGGSFNPPHYGHIFACHYALLRWGLEKIFVIPNFSHAFGKKLIPFPHRFAMTKLAFEALQPIVEVHPIESEMATTNYTVDTIKELCRRYPQKDFRLILGGDIAHEFQNWKDFELLQEIAAPLFIPRMANNKILSNDLSPGVLPDISSTQIRRLISEETHQLTAFLPLKVQDYIRENNLYREQV